MKQQILFVCLGNICRSPAADGIMHHIVEREGLSSQIEIDSAGTYGGHAGELPDPRMRVTAAKRGYQLTHRSRRISTYDMERFSMIVVMDDSNYEDVSRLANSQEELDKIYRMAEFCPKSGQRYVPDPYYGGDQGFELVIDMLEEGCENILELLKKKI